MKRLCLLGFLLLFALPALADRISATIAITNAPTTNGMQIVITTSGASTRTWTNVVSTASSQIATNATATGSATNLFSQLLSYPPSGAIPRMTSPTNIVLDANNGVNLTVAFSVPAGPGYASVSYSTQTVGSAYDVRVPNTIESSATKTNVASGLVGWLNLNSATQQLAQASPAMAQLVGLTNNQTISGNKTMTGTNALGFITVGTNGVLRGTSLVNGGITNATSISGNLALLTNGTLRSPIAIDPTLTNGVNYGNPFRSPGSGTDSEQFGTSASATGGGALALGYTAIASGTLSMGFGYGSSATGDGSITIGPGSFASGTNSSAIGYTASSVGFNYATALGYAATATGSNQIRLGRSSDYVSIPGGLTVIGQITNAALAGTNTFPSGSDISFGRYTLTSLANGANAALPVNTNVFVEVSGNSAAASINGIDASPNRNGAFRILLYRQTYTLTIANESGLDPTAANRIRTQTGADVSSAGPCAMFFIYNSSASRWDLLNLWSVESGISSSTASNIAVYVLSASGAITNLDIRSLSFLDNYFQIINTNTASGGSAFTAFTEREVSGNKITVGQSGAPVRSKNGGSIKWATDDDVEMIIDAKTNALVIQADTIAITGTNGVLINGVMVANGAGITNGNASELRSGSVAIARLGTNTPSATQVLTASSASTYGWATPAAVGVTGMVSNQFTTNWPPGTPIVGNVNLAGSTNHASGDLGVDGTLGAATANTASLAVIGNATIGGTVSSTTSTTAVQVVTSQFLIPAWTNLFAFLKDGVLTPTNDFGLATNLNANELRSGSVPIARLGTNTPITTQVLTASSASTYGWATPSAGSSGYQSVDASNIVAGTLSNARLAATVVTNNGTLTGLQKGDGGRGVTAAAFSDVQSLASGNILTNGESVAATFSNSVTVASGQTTTLGNVTGNGGTGGTNVVTGGIISTSTVANTFVKINGAQNGSDGDVLSATTNAVKNFNVTYSGNQTNSGNIQSATLNTTSILNVGTGINVGTGNVTLRGTVSGSAGFAHNGAGGMFWYSAGVVSLRHDTASSPVTLFFGSTNAGWPAMVGTSNSGPLFAMAASLTVSNTIAATNGFIFYQLQTIPTNSIPPSSALITNYVELNLTNTIGGGGRISVATNYTSAGSFVLCKNGVTTYYP